MVCLHSAILFSYFLLFMPPFWKGGGDFFAVFLLLPCGLFSDFFFGSLCGI